MDKCPKCGLPMAEQDQWGILVPNDRDECLATDNFSCLRRQLAQRDARIAELEAKLAAAARLAQDSADAAGEMAQCHGQVVPVELVEAIDLAFDGSNAHSDQWITNVRAAIKAALGGAM